jgi:quercetin dioxygenase-like cupin family protein
MKLLAATTMSLGLMVSAAAYANQSSAPSGATAAPATSGQAVHAISITRSGSQPSAKGPTEYFTGTVRIDSPFQASNPARVGGGTVTFEPGARSAWHTHPLGQTLIVTAGVGRVQQWGSPVQEMRPSDVVWIPPGVKHWHGAGPTTGMTHIAINEALDGKGADWMEKATDEQYRAN